MCSKSFVYKWRLVNKSKFRKIVLEIYKNKYENNYAMYMLKQLFTNN